MKLSTCLYRFFDQYLTDIKGVSKNTVKTYRDTFKLLLPFAAKYHGMLPPVKNGPTFRRKSDPPNRKELMIAAGRIDLSTSHRKSIP